MGAGQIPSTSETGEVSLVRVGWTSTWCAGERQVTVSVALGETIAVCGQAVDPCDPAEPERPEIDADEAITAVPPSDTGTWHAVYHLSGLTSDAPFWQVSWQEDAGQLFALVDAQTSEILPCREGGPETCRDADTFE